MALHRAASAIRRRGSLPLPLLAGAPARAMASLFGHVEPAPKDPILGVTEAFLADPSPDKVNVGVVRAPPSRSSLVPFSLDPNPGWFLNISGCGLWLDGTAGRLPGRQRQARRARLRA